MQTKQERQAYVNQYGKDHYIQEWSYCVDVEGTYVSLSGAKFILSKDKSLTLNKEFAVYEFDGHKFVLNKSNIKRLRTIKKK